MAFFIGVGAVDALGRRGGELLRLLARGQRRPELEPARLVAHLADRPVDLAVDDVVEIAAPPFVGDEGLVVEVARPVSRPLRVSALDGGAEALLVAGLAGFVFGARHGRGGTRGRHLGEDESGGGEAGNGGPKVAQDCAHKRARLRPRGARGIGGRLDMGIARTKCSSGT